jgi:uncharacterized protein
MVNNIKDDQYFPLVDYILKDKEFTKIADSNHHGTSRFDHSVRVSYFSYKIAKKLGLDYETTAKAGLLHDFFITDEDNKTIVDSVKSIFKHSKIAVNNSINQFGISEKEKNIIETHMFPLNIKPPKYAEGWLITMIDKAVGIYEFGHKFRYLSTLWTLFMINLLK